MRLGLLGFGNAGQGIHAPLVEAVPGLELAAIVTGDPGRQARARAAHPAAAVLSEPEELWARADLDAVIVSVPNRVHVPLAFAAIELGLPVVVDAPLAPTLAEAEWLVAQAAAHEVPLTVFHQRRWDGDFLTVRRLLGQDALGPVVRLESRFERFRPAVEPGAWRERPEVTEGGGVLLDVGVHLVDQAIHLFGDPVEVYGETAARRPGSEVADDAFIALEHPNGVRTHLSCGLVSALGAPRFRVLGLNGAVIVDSLDAQERHLRMGLRPGDRDFGLVRPGRLAGPAGEADVAIERGAWTTFYVAQREALLGRSALPVDPADALMALRVLELAAPAAAA